MPRAHDAQPLPVDDDPSEVDWLATEDESEQANRLAGKKPMVAPTKKRARPHKEPPRMKVQKG
jgi:hypothetical protein